MDEATIGMAGHAWLADIRGHAGYENLRLALVGPVRKCRPCDGIGSLHDGSRCAYAGERDACPDGVGCGTVPTPAAPTPA